MQDSVVEMSEAVPAIGIDLGTTYSSLGVYRFGKVEIIANGFGNRITPSMVAFDDGEFLSGEPARQQAQSNIENTLYDAKRLMGRKFDDPVVQKDLKNWPFKLIGDENNLPRFEITRQDGSKMEFSPEQISAMILTHLKQTAERFLGKTVVDVVITVPAYFNNLQRKATKDAAMIANLNVLRIVNEPTAAAIGYGLLNGKTGHHNVLVFDLGGGTFDVSILNYNQKHFVVVAVGGDTHLGGQDIDLCLVNHFVEEIKKKHQKDITTNKRAMMKLRQACELIKRTLSIQTLAKINIESLYDGVDFKSLISQALFDELNADLFNSTLKTVESTLKDAKMNKSEIEDILMVGGSTRIPKLQKMIKEFFGKEPIQSINPDEAVAYGACAVAAMLSGDSSAEILEKIFTDVTPLSLGIQLLNNVMRPLIPRNTQIPAIYSHVFVTTIDFQKTMNFIVFQGESEKANENLLLGNFKMTNIPAGLAKSQRAEVTFEIDANGILNVKAVLHSTQKEIGITIDTKGHLCKQEIEGMVEQAHQLLQDDAQRQELRQAKNDLEQFCWKIKSIFSDGSLVTSTVLESIMEKCNATLEWLDMTRSTDKEEFEKREEKLRAICAPHMPSEVLQID